jgi:S1-C subfamily serine protease
MNRSQIRALVVTLALIFLSGVTAGLWLNRKAPAERAPAESSLPRDAGETVVMEVYRTRSPSVVNIVTQKLSLTYWMQVVPGTGQGTGFFIDPHGHILTNYHVVANAVELEVTAMGGRQTPAKLVGRDPFSDLAVIKVEPFPGLEPAPLGDSAELAVGQRVIAIGNPFGLQHTVTSGFISALNRDINVGHRTLLGMIQTDASINPGNSGGPLIDSLGKVIGVNTAIFAPSGGYTGIGFALPIDRAKKVARQIIDMGRVIYPWLGVKSWMDLDQGLAKQMGLPPIQGVLIFEVIPGSPAALVGLRGGTNVAFYKGRPILVGGDVILGVDGTPTPTFDDYLNVTFQKNVGDSVTLRCQRGSQVFEVEPTLFADPGSHQ